MHQYMQFFQCIPDRILSNILPFASDNLRKEAASYGTDLIVVAHQEVMFDRMSQRTENLSLFAPLPPPSKICICE